MINLSFEHYTRVRTIHVFIRVLLFIHTWTTILTIWNRFKNFNNMFLKLMCIPINRVTTLILFRLQKWKIITAKQKIILTDKQVRTSYNVSHRTKPRILLSVSRERQNLWTNHSVWSVSIYLPCKKYEVAMPDIRIRNMILFNFFYNTFNSRKKCSAHIVQYFTQTTVLNRKFKLAIQKLMHLFSRNDVMWTPTKNVFFKCNFLLIAFISRQ